MPWKGAEGVPGHPLVNTYLRHQRASNRHDYGSRDIGALESGLIFNDDFESDSSDWWTSILP